MTSRSYAWWAGRLAASLADVLCDDFVDDLARQRAKRDARELLVGFDAECRAYEAGIREPEIAPQSIRAELAEIAARPETFFPGAAS